MHEYVPSMFNQSYLRTNIRTKRGALSAPNMLGTQVFFLIFVIYISIDRSSVTMKILHTLGEFYGMPTFFAQLLSNFFVICFSVELVKL